MKYSRFPEYALVTVMMHWAAILALSNGYLVGLVHAMFCVCYALTCDLADQWRRLSDDVIKDLKACNDSWKELYDEQHAIICDLELNRPDGPNG